MGEEVEELVATLRAEEIAYGAYKDDHERGMSRLLGAAAHEITKLRAILGAVMDVEKAEPTGDPYDPASWASAAKSVVAGSEHERVCAERDSLRASLTRAEARAELAEAGLPGLLFSKRKEIVERCAQIVESYARKAGEERAYMLKGPVFWLRDIANAVRTDGLSRDSDVGSQ